jgi:hypothetical protein
MPRLTSREEERELTYLSEHVSALLFQLVPDKLGNLHSAKRFPQRPLRSGRQWAAWMGLRVVGMEERHDNDPDVRLLPDDSNPLGAVHLPLFRHLLVSHDTIRLKCRIIRKY